MDGIVAAGRERVKVRPPEPAATAARRSAALTVPDRWLY
jgi:hypothetical protein